jgi:hypothetical protein
MPRPRLAWYSKAARPVSDAGVAEFDPARMLRTLARHDVKYVLIGGFAAAIHGSPYVTTDIDIVPADERDNLTRLSSALRELGSDQDPESLKTQTVTTEAGDLDLTFLPAGTTGYRDVVRDAEQLEILGVIVPVASLADVVRSKEAAGREKDRVQLPLLRRLLDEP